jgi:threonine dehydratase
MEKTLKVKTDVNQLNSYLKDNNINFDFENTAKKLKDIVTRTPLAFNQNLSDEFGCKVYLKREDLQIVRSYKLRGAYNLMSSLPKEKLAKGVVCASAGNHAQGFAYSCTKLKVKGTVFMPVITPNQKIKKTKKFGGEFIEIKLVGDTYDDCAAAAKKFVAENDQTFIPPFDDVKVIEGQGTVGVEILEDLPNVDYIFMPVGGGGLTSGVGVYFRNKSPQTKIIGLEAVGAPAMYESLIQNKPITLDKIDPFADGVSVKRVGTLTFNICKNVIDELHLVAEGHACSTILSLYNEEAIVVEPAGALSISALDDYREEIKGKTIVCVISGGNNDIDRMQEIKERSLQYEGLKHYFLIRFAQRPGALKHFVNEVLSPTDDITRFEYMQKTNKEMGPALVGVELKKRSDYDSLLERMQKYGINYTELRKDDKLFEYMV